jgi:hypothetical protein
MLINGEIIPDSTMILNWLEKYTPQPALPTTDKGRAQAFSGKS